MNTDLIEKLKAIEPSGRLISLESLANDVKLEQLAPTMRIEILEMAKEIEELNNELRKLKLFRSTKKILGDSPQPKIQMATACGRFEPTNINNNTCKNCGRSRYLHATPQP